MYLLDTHTMLWFLMEPDKLSEKAGEILMNKEQVIFVSAISFWEISLKFSIGKLNLWQIQPDELPHFVEKSGIEIIPLDYEIASSFHQLPRLAHKDPFDRMLVWQAIKSNLSLLSKDKSMKIYTEHGLKVVW